MIGYLSDFLDKIGTPNLFVIGIAILVIWLLISGFRKGLRRGGRGEDSEKRDRQE